MGDGMMRKTVAWLFCLMLMLCAGAYSAEEVTGIVAKVNTGKGPLKLRNKAEDKARVLDEIPNGTCILVLQEGEEWSEVSYQNQTGFCKTAFLTFLREADSSMLDYRVLRKGMKGEDVLQIKQRLQELGYIRSGSDLTNVYNDTLEERIILFQRQTGVTENGIASQELQAYLFSDNTPACTQTLPRIRSRVSSQDSENRVICGCCMGEGCECCGFTGWIIY